MKTQTFRSVAVVAAFVLFLGPAASNAQQFGGNHAESVQDQVISGPSYQRSIDLGIQTNATIEDLVANAPSLTESQWNDYARNLEAAISSDNSGIRTAALRLIIAYSEHLDLSSEATVDVMRLYREGETDQIRRMAVVSLSQMNSPAAMGFLRLSADFEQSEAVKSTILAVLNSDALPAI